MHHDHHEEALAYIGRLRRMGCEDDVIRRQLLTAGWSESDADGLLARSAPAPPPAAPGPSSDAPSRYQEFAETVGGVPSLNRQDNLIQGITVGAATLIGAMAGAARYGVPGALLGAGAGLIGSALISGFVLMIVGITRAANRRKRGRW